MLERLLHLARDRQRQRSTAGGGIGQYLVERALGPRRAMAVDVGEAEHMRGEAGLRVEPVGAAVEREARLAKRVDRLDQMRRGAACKEIEGLVRTQHRQIVGSVTLGHQPGERAGEVELVADHASGVDADAPHVDRPGKQLALAIDDVAARRDQRDRPAAPPGMVAERRQPHQPKHDDGDDPGIEDHPEHQPLVDDREDLPPLSDQTEPLGPCDESGRRGVH